MTLKRSLAAVLVTASFAATFAAPAARAETVLTVVPHSNLAILDPIWTTAT
jgi:hypothetical protein